MVRAVVVIPNWTPRLYFRHVGCDLGKFHEAEAEAEAGAFGLDHHISLHLYTIYLKIVRDLLT